MTRTISRRTFLGAAAAAALASSPLARAQAPVFQPPAAAGVEILHPQARVPLSFFIDDSTCLANMGYFCMPQFAEAWPASAIYKKPWKTWPREIPDAFLREFGEFCSEHGVRGKFSIVPYPACVGWLDRELPGWSRSELRDSLKLVRTLMLPGWDIHPEMISHTRVIDLATGRPTEPISAGTMENSFPQQDKSVDEMAAYLAYALKILKNCELPCEGITTPGGFGNRVKSELSKATGQAVREVFGAEIPHYFKYVSGGKESTAPKLEHVTGADTDAPQLVVNVPAGTGDWFGNWDGDGQPEGPKYASRDGSSGRMVELIQKNEPAIMLCHWPGLYTQGTKKGFEHFKDVIAGLEQHRDRTLWMKISEISRYWAARGLTRISRQNAEVTLAAPFACPKFTIRVPGQAGAPKLTQRGEPVALQQVSQLRDLKPGTWLKEEQGIVLCFDLAKGTAKLNV